MTHLLGFSNEEYFLSKRMFRLEGDFEQLKCDIVETMSKALWSSVLALVSVICSLSFS